MSAPNRELFTNNAATTLASSANTTTTSLSLTDGSSFPSTGNFRVIVGSEIMLATARSSNTLTVVRGQESTSAASHTSGDDVTHVLTQGALSQTGVDNVPLWGAMPALNTLNGLSASDFTVVDSSVASSLSDSAGGLVFTKPATSGLDHSVAVISAPSAPYSYIAAIQLLIPSTSGISSGGMTLYKASSGEHYGLEVGMNNNVNGYQFWKVVKYSEMPSPLITGVASGELSYFAPMLWMKVEDDNTNVNFYIGLEGSNWILVASEGRTSGFGHALDSVGLYLNNNGNDNAALLRAVHFSRAS